MRWQTHLAGGAMAGAVIVAASINREFGLGGELPVLYPLVAAAGAVGGLIPDIDLRTSKLGQGTKGVSFIISVLVGHRTLFHAPALYILLYVLFGKYFGAYRIFPLAFVAGALSHIFLDMMNTKGVPLLYPIPGHFHVARIKTGSKGDKITCHILLCLLVCMVVRDVAVLLHLLPF